MTAGRNRLGGDVSRTRFRVEQDCFHDSREVAAHARSVVGEHGGNPLDVRGTRIARHQMLYQADRNERTDVGMVEHDAQRLVEVLLRGLTRRQRIAETVFASIS